MNKRIFLRGAGWKLLLILAVLFLAFAVIYSLYISAIILNGG